jgi:hypothetical protein
LLVLAIFENLKVPGTEIRYRPAFVVVDGRLHFDTAYFDSEPGLCQSRGLESE